MVMTAGFAWFIKAQLFVVASCRLTVMERLSGEHFVKFMGLSNLKIYVSISPGSENRCGFEASMFSFVVGVWKLIREWGTHHCR